MKCETLDTAGFIVTAVGAAGRGARQRSTAEARRVGEQTMEQEVRRAMRIDYFD